MQVDVREQRRSRCPLRNALRALRPRPILDDPRGHPFLDQPQDPSVRDPVLKEPLQPSMVKAGEELTEIRVEHPVHLLARDAGSERIQRIMRGAPGPEPVREAEKVRLVDRVQHLDDRPLKDLVLQRSDTERPQPPVRLWDEHSPGRSRPVAPAMNPSMKIPKIRLEILPVLRPRHTIDTRSGLWANRPVRRPEPVDLDVVQERCEPRVLVLLRHPAHTVQVTERARSGTASGARFAGRVSLGRPASLHHLRRPALGVVRQLRRYYQVV